MYGPWKNFGHSSNQDMQEGAHSGWNRQADKSRHDMKSDVIHDPHAGRQDGYFSLSESVVLQQFRGLPKPTNVRAFPKQPVGFVNDFHGLDCDERVGREKSNPSTIKSQYVPSYPNLHLAAQEKKTSETGSVSELKENKLCRNKRALAFALIGIAIIAAAVSCTVAYRFAFESPLSTRSWHIADVEMRVNDSFQPGMSNSTSPVSQRFGDMFCSNVRSSLDPVLNAQICTATKLRPGSVVVTFQLLINIFTETSSEHLREILTGNGDSEFVHYGAMTVFRTSVQVHGLSVCRSLSECENEMMKLVGQRLQQTMSTKETTKVTSSSTPKTTSASTSKMIPASTSKATPTPASSLKTTRVSVTTKTPVSTTASKATKPTASTASTAKTTSTSTTKASSNTRPLGKPSPKEITENLTTRKPLISATPFPVTSQRSLQTIIAPLATKMAKPASTTEEVTKATATTTAVTLSAMNKLPAADTTTTSEKITTSTLLSSGELSTRESTRETKKERISAESPADVQSVTPSISAETIVPRTSVLSTKAVASTRQSSTARNEEHSKTDFIQPSTATQTVTTVLLPGIPTILPSAAAMTARSTASKLACDDLSEEIRRNNVSLYQCPVDDYYYLPEVDTFPNKCERFVRCLNGKPDNSSATCGSDRHFLYDPNHRLGDCGFPSHPKTFCNLRRRAEKCKSSPRRASDP